uniref:Uncharacterized protein n=1 Tax=Lotus japonicus TaxID=34305 RepID=I3SJP7_LOTJA|nr:unknown [Lotus japonicus]
MSKEWALRTSQSPPGNSLRDCRRLMVTITLRHSAKCLLSMLALDSGCCGTLSSLFLIPKQLQRFMFLETSIIANCLK